MSYPGRTFARLSEDVGCPPRQGEAPWVNPAGRAWLMADPRRYRRRAVWGHAAWSRSVWVRSASRRYVRAPEPRWRARRSYIGLAFVAAIALIAAIVVVAVLNWR